MFIVKYSGPFGYIKPWTAVRDDETFSQQFLTPSIIEGMEKKLFPELLNEKGIKKIIRHRLTYSAMDRQQEVTQPKGRKGKFKNDFELINATVNTSIINRRILLNPTLYLTFEKREDAERAKTQHLCLCRNEDIILPEEEIIEVSEEEFDAPDGRFKGFELIFGKTEDAFIVGGNRFDEGKFMYGTLKIVGNNPLKSEYEHE